MNTVHQSNGALLAASFGKKLKRRAERRASVSKRIYMRYDVKSVVLLSHEKLKLTTIITFSVTHKT